MSCGSSPVQSSLLLLVVGILGLAGCNPMTAWTNNQNGKVFYRAGRYAEASEEFRRAALDDPSNPDYIHNYATASRRSGRYQAAEQAYRQALALDPNHQPSYHGLAVTLNKTGRMGEAYNLLAGWAAAQPRSSKPLIEMAWLQKEMGDVTGAERSLAQALRMRPGHPLALANLGQIYEETGRRGLALSAYQRSLATDWNQPQVASHINQLGGSPNRLPPPPMIAAAPSSYNPISYMSNPNTVPTPVATQPMPRSAPTPGPIASPGPPSGSGQQTSMGGQAPRPGMPFQPTPAGHLPNSPYRPSPGMPLARQPFQPSTGAPLASQPFANGRAYMGIASPTSRTGIRQSSGQVVMPMVPRR